MGGERKTRGVEDKLGQIRGPQQREGGENGPPFVFGWPWIRERERAIFVRNGALAGDANMIWVQSGGQGIVVNYFGCIHEVQNFPNENSNRK